MTALVFDFGLRAIGVAVAEREARFAHGLATIGARDGVPHWPALSGLIDEWRPGELVVGEPFHMDGTRGEMCARARAFGAGLERRYGLPVAYADERLSTFEAVARGANAGDAHALAAQAIAETWLASAAEAKRKPASASRNTGDCR